MDIPSIFQSMTVCTRYPEPIFMMERLEPPKESMADTGWFVGCYDEGHNHNDSKNLRCVSLYEAYLNQRGIEQFMCFPIGSMVDVDSGKGLQIFKDGRALDIVPGSYLAAMLKKHGRWQTPS